jgi:hypothetical protein
MRYGYAGKRGATVESLDREVTVVTVGVVLLLMAGVLTVDILLENSGRTDTMIMGQALSFDVWGLYVLGLATGVLVVAGIQITVHGLARERRRRIAERRQERELAALGRTGNAGPVPAGQPLVPAGPAPARAAAATAPAPPTAATTPRPAGSWATVPTSTGVAPTSAPAVVQPGQGPTAGSAGAAHTAPRPGSQAAAPRASSASSPPAADAGARPNGASRSDGSRAGAEPDRPSAGTGGTARRGDRVVARVADLRRKKNTAAGESPSKPVNTRS